MLADHEFFLTCDPHLHKFERITPSNAEPNQLSGPAIPHAIKERLNNDKTPLPPTEYYRVTDLMHTLPAGLWDTNVVSDYEFTDLPGTGVYVRVRSPMGIVMDTLWEVREATSSSGQSELELVEDVTITCSRFLVGIVKGQCDAGWKGVHGRLLGRLEGKA
jgi:hypothetical protein